MRSQIVMSRTHAIAEVVESLVANSARSIDGAIYRFNNPHLAAALSDAVRRGVMVRVILDRNKFEESRSTRELFSGGAIPFRLLHGRQGPGSKMHHKFVILDGKTLLTGSYNWTPESEEQNYENLLVLHECEKIDLYRLEFEALWAESSPPA